MEQRSSPDQLLKRAQEEERLEQRGKLKIYLGAAPGVGKTYTMLQDAHVKRTQGLDVVVGIVESHGRREVEDLLKNLDILPRQTINYRGKQLLEFDLDSALKRNPGLILIDEMAHANVPNLRHAKRWQDIKELLDRGIDVSTTLNIQHIESYKDIVSQITQIVVKETVPDTMLDLADTIELVDLPPEDLLKRLQEGKVYFPEQAELAKKYFFRIGNLIALRELALRVTAERVEAQVLLHRQNENIKRIWPTQEKILVCVGPGTESHKLIRAARRMAGSLHAEWLAVHVDAPRLRLSEAQRNNAIRNLRFAEQLGAETRILTGFDVVKEIMNFAREQNVTQIMIWKQIRPRLRDFFFRSLADEIVRNSGEIDVHIVTPSLSERISGTNPPKPILFKNPFDWKTYAISLGIVGLATVINLFLSPYLATSNLIMVYLLGITLVALFGRIGPSILASVMSVLAYYFFFMETRFSFALNGLHYFLTLVIMFLVAQIISHLTILARRQAKNASFAEHHTACLHRLSRKLASTRGIEKLLKTAVPYIGEFFNCGVSALLPEGNRLTILATYKTEPSLDAKEQSVAQWVYDLGQKAGLGTDTLPFSNALYMPLLSSQGSMGVIRIQPFQSQYLFTPEQMNLLESFANQIAMAIEVDRLEEQTKKKQLQTEAEHARTSLLRSISYDLRTPLGAIMESASSLLEHDEDLVVSKIKKVGERIYLESEQLNRLVNNLLHITYLEAKAMNLKMEDCSLNDVIGSVLQISRKKLGNKPVHIHLASDLPKIPFDNSLIQEVFINLIDNTIKFTSPETLVEISAYTNKNKLVVSVEDRGPGIAPDEVHKLFEKFYRGRRLTTERGLGLGLAICYQIIKAHGGEIWAENRKDGGAAFYFTLPLH